MTTTPRTLALFGATGKTGRHVLAQALEAGHSVRALARRPEALDAHERLAVVAGDVRDSDAVRETVRGSDAVVSVFGQVKGSPPTLQTEGTQAIVDAMAEQGIRRIISLSGGGLPAEEHDQPKVPDRIIRWLLRRLSPAVLDDAIAHLAVLRASGLDWTVVRGPRLTDAPATGSYRVGWVGVNASTQIARADLARFILTQLDDDTFVHELPFVST
ncbi:MAG: SDR family oxidoreductase [Actinobacteria bacterium]|nr:SDR family oxidoreductase [Actinomycetota bacterium]MBU1609973.1 SDR family oxidoreductase [Actinomycetota bacterium]MBU2315659.1 SDR family oxidoreductase [Actinomycetota bacterium]MBU2385513.1 SDR family oxidoreductase [Actinomycetota bacterium]